MQRHRLGLVKEDEEVLLKEQAMLDDHEDRVTDLMSRLLDLEVEERKDTSTVANPSKPFKKRLGRLTVNYDPLMEKMVSLVSGPDFDLCLAQHLAEGIGELKSELLDITRGLSLLESDNAILSGGH